MNQITLTSVLNIATIWFARDSAKLTDIGISWDSTYAISMSTNVVRIPSYSLLCVLK